MIYTNQFFKIFTTESRAENKISRFIKLSNKQIQTSINRIVAKYHQITTSKVIKLNQNKSDKFSWYRSSTFLYSFLFEVYSELGRKNIDAKNFVYEKFQENILLNEISYTEQDYYLKLLSLLDLSKLSFNEEELIDRFISNIKWIDNIEVFAKLEEIFPVTFKDTINDDFFIEKVTEVIQGEIEEVEDSNTYDLIGKLENIENKFSFDFWNEIQELKKKGENYDGYIESQIESYIEDRREFDSSVELSKTEELEIINQIFNSLIDE